MSDEKKIEDKPPRSGEAIRVLSAVLLFLFLFVCLFMYLLMGEVGFLGWELYVLVNFFGTMILGRLLRRMWPVANLVAAFPVIITVIYYFESIISGSDIDEPFYYFIYMILLPGGSSLSGSFLGYYFYKKNRENLALREQNTDETKQ